jgi:hypothetical protein
VQIQGWSRAKRQALIDGRTDDIGLLASRSRESLDLKQSLQGRALDAVEDEDESP